MNPEIRREMEGVLDNMCRDQKLVSRYYIVKKKKDVFKKESVRK